MATMASLSETYIELIRKYYGEQMAQVLSDGFTRGTIQTKSSKPNRPQCMATNCGVELCQELDAYYGKNPDGKRYCAKCRRMKRIS